MAAKRKYFNKKDIEELQAMGAVKHFDTAVHQQYKMSTPKEMNERICDMYEALADTNKISRNWSCGHCAYIAYKIIGERYYQSLDKLK